MTLGFPASSDPADDNYVAWTIIQAAERSIAKHLETAQLEVEDIGHLDLVKVIGVAVLPASTGRLLE